MYAPYRPSVLFGGRMDYTREAGMTVSQRDRS
jgi:hypothetical protein